MKATDLQLRKPVAVFGLFGLQKIKNKTKPASFSLKNE